MLFLQWGYQFRRHLLVVVAKGGFEAVNEIFYGLPHKRQRMDCVAKSMTVNEFPSRAAAGAAAVHPMGGLLWGVVGLAVIGPCSVTTCAAVC